MKTITLTSNEALVLIAEGMTMNNVKSLANKLRNADAPMPAVYPSNDAYNDALKQVEKAKAQSKTWEQSYHDAMISLNKAKRTEIKLRDEIRNLENDARQDDESLKYFRKWVEELRVVLECDKGLTTASVFSQAVQMIKESNRLGDRVVELESRLNKANNVIACVKDVYDAKRDYAEIMVDNIKVYVEEYYRGN